MKVTAVEMPQGIYTHSSLSSKSGFLSMVEFGLTCLPVFESLLQHLCQSDLCSLVWWIYKEYITNNLGNFEREWLQQKNNTFCGLLFVRHYKKCPVISFHPQKDTRRQVTIISSLQIRKPKLGIVKKFLPCPTAVKCQWDPGISDSQIWEKAKASNSFTWSQNLSPCDFRPPF